MYAALADAVEQRVERPIGPGDHLSRRRPGFRRRQRPRRLPRRPAARRRRNSGLAAASRARELRDADRRRGPRQLRRHRHDHAAPLRPGHRRGGRALLDAVRRSRRWCPKRRARCCFRASPAAAAPRAICCSPSRSGSTKPWRSASPAIAPRPGELDATLEAIVAALLAKPAEALRQTQRLLRRGTRDEILERMKLESGLFAERLASAEVEGGDQRLLREAAKADPERPLGRGDATDALACA